METSFLFLILSRAEEDWNEKERKRIQREQLHCDRFKKETVLDHNHTSLLSGIAMAMRWGSLPDFLYAKNHHFSA